MPLTKLNATLGLTGTLPAVSGANLTGISAGITMADQWRLSTTFSGNANPIVSNWERVDATARLQGTIGSAMSVDGSGYWTFPSTGIYLVAFKCNYALNGDDRSISSWIYATNDNSSYNATAWSTAFLQQTNSNYTGSSAYVETLVDVTNTSNDKIYFRISVQNSSTEIQGNTNESLTFATFTRIGDT